MADTLAAINSKLDKALDCIKEIENLKQKQRNLEEKNKELEASLSFAHDSVEALKKELALQNLVIKELKEDVKSLTNQAKEEKERAVNLESHSRRYNLNFVNIPEQKDESFEKSEKVLRRFMEVKFKLSKKDVNDISFERVHRIGKSSLSHQKPRPIIAKLTFHKDKKICPISDRNLRDTNFAIARDFPKEIVEKRKLLVPILKDAKKNGDDARLIYDKLYINGQLHKP